MIEIQNFLKGQELYAPCIGNSSAAGSSTRSANTLVNLNSATSKLEPIWNTLQTSKGDNDSIRTILLKNETSFLGYIRTKSNGKIKERMDNPVFKLAIKKINGTLVARIITFIPENKYIKTTTLNNNITDLGFDLSKTNYSGLQLVSTLDGTFLFGDKFDEGKIVYHFVPTATYKQYCCEHGEHSHEGEKHHAVTTSSTAPEKEHIFLQFYTFPKYNSTRAGTYNMEENEEKFTCSTCGKDADECTCLTITPDTPTEVCFSCGMEKRFCFCCSRCNQYPCRCCFNCGQYPCQCCSSCGQPKYRCMCHLGGGTGGGNSSTTKPQILPDKIIACDTENISPYIRKKVIAWTCAKAS